MIGGGVIVIVKVFVGDKFSGNVFVKFLVFLMVVNGIIIIFVLLVGGLVLFVVIWCFIFIILIIVVFIILIGVVF